MPNLETLVSVSTKESIDVWTFAGTHLRTIQLPAQTSSLGLISLDDEHVVLPQCDRSMLMIVNWKTGQVKLRSHVPEYIKPLCLSHNKEYLVGGSGSGKMYIWHVASGELVRVVEAHYKGVSCLAFTDNDSILLSGGDDGVLNAWIMADLLVADDPLENKFGNSNHTKVGLYCHFSNHALPITGIYCGACPTSGGKIMTCSLDRSVKVYQLPSKTMVQSYILPSALTSITMDVAESFFLCGGSDGKIYYQSLLQTIVASSQNTETNNQHTLANLFQDTKKKQDVYKFENHDGGAIALSGHLREVNSVILNSNNTKFISASNDGTIKVWDVATRTMLQSIRAHGSPIHSVSIILDVETALNVKKDRVLKQFPYFTKYICGAIPLVRGQDYKRVNMSCGVVGFVNVTDVNTDYETTEQDKEMEDLVYNCGDQGIVTNSTATASANSMNVVNKKRKLNEDSESVAITINENVAVPSVKEEVTPQTKTDKQQPSYEELVAEVRKWKATAAELFKKNKAK